MQIGASTGRNITFTYFFIFGQQISKFSKCSSDTHGHIYADFAFLFLTTNFTQGNHWINFLLTLYLMVHAFGFVMKRSCVTSALDILRSIFVRGICN